MRATLKLFLAALAIQKAAAHTIFTTLYVDGVSQGDTTCIRMNQDPETCTAPIPDISSNDMACGIMGETGVSRVCSAGQGSRLTFQFKLWADGSQPGVIDSSHKGPCAVYMKAVDSAISDPGYGDGWFKIWEAGYDADTEEWCTTKLINADGYLDITLPSDLAGGYYLVRPELLALQNAQATPSDPQFYIGCAQLFLDSPATAVPTDTVSIPGYIEAGDPSVVFDIYNPVFPYPMFGPSVYENGSQIDSNIPDINSQKRKVLTQTEGFAPSGSILCNGNWCGIEVAAYSDEDGCWNASNACWDQDGFCYNSTVTGPKNCPIWEDYCYSIQGACNTSNFVGPPDVGKNLNPAPVTLSFASSYTETSTSSPNEAATSSVEAASATEDASSMESTPTAEPSSSVAVTSEAITALPSSKKPTSTYTMTTFETVKSYGHSHTRSHSQSNAAVSTPEAVEVAVVTDYVTIVHTVTETCSESQASAAHIIQSSTSVVDSTVVVYATLTVYPTPASVSKLSPTSSQQTGLPPDLSSVPVSTLAPDSGTDSTSNGSPSESTIQPLSSFPYPSTNANISPSNDPASVSQLVSRISTSTAPFVSAAVSTTVQSFSDSVVSSSSTSLLSTYKPFPETNFTSSAPYDALSCESQTLMDFSTHFTQPYLSRTISTIRDESSSMVTVYVTIPAGSTGTSKSCGTVTAFTASTTVTEKTQTSTQSISSSRTATMTPSTSPFITFDDR